MTSCFKEVGDEMDRGKSQDTHVFCVFKVMGVFAFFSLFLSSLFFVGCPGFSGFFRLFIDWLLAYFILSTCKGDWTPSDVVRVL
jgi:hypothetical protein